MNKFQNYKMKDLNLLHQDVYVCSVKDQKLQEHNIVLNVLSKKINFIQNIIFIYNNTY